MNIDSDILNQENLKKLDDLNNQKVLNDNLTEKYVKCRICISGQLSA